MASRIKIRYHAKIVNTYVVTNSTTLLAHQALLVGVHEPSALAARRDGRGAGARP
jgi:hypothetical protein